MNELVTDRSSIETCCREAIGTGIRTLRRLAEAGDLDQVAIAAEDVAASVERLTAYLTRRGQGQLLPATPVATYFHAAHRTTDALDHRDEVATTAYFWSPIS